VGVVSGCGMCWLVDVATFFFFVLCFSLVMGLRVVGLFGIVWSEVCLGFLLCGRVGYSDGPLCVNCGVNIVWWLIGVGFVTLGVAHDDLLFLGWWRGP